MYHLVVFDSGSGNIMASIYDNNTETIENYKLHQSSQDGAAVMMAMMPLLLKDDEFDENFQTYFDQRSAGYPDMKKATDAMASCVTMLTAVLRTTPVRHISRSHWTNPEMCFAYLRGIYYQASIPPLPFWQVNLPSLPKRERPLFLQQRLPSTTGILSVNIS